jgi:histidine triad (HIT) family protein
MALTQNQIDELKSQLMQQVSHLPADQRVAAEQQIAELSPEALETMLQEERSKKQNQAGDSKQKTIFRSIVDGEIPAVIVDDTPEAKALMDIAPISKGHVLIIPKVPVKDAKQLPLKAFTLAKKIAQRISKMLKAQETVIQTENKFGETVIHVIPSYGDTKDLASPRTKSNKEELEQLASSLRSKKRKPRVKKVKQVVQSVPVKSQVLARPRRIP